MSLRRLSAIVLLALLPLSLSPQPAGAQSADLPNFFTPGNVSGGVLGCDYASRSFSNLGTAFTLYSFLVPQAYVATMTLAPTLTATNTSWNWTSDVPLHFRALGTFRTNPGSGAGGNFNLGVNFGGATATITLVNAHPLSGNLTDAPWRLDVYLMPYASAVAANTLRVWGEFQYATEAGSNAQLMNQRPTPPQFYAYVLGTTSIATAQTFTVSAQFASATITNSMNRHSACWKLGE